MSAAKEKKTAAEGPVIKPEINGGDKKTSKSKKKGGVSGLIVLLVLIVIAGGGLYVIVHFNLFNARGIIVDTVLATALKIDPEYVSYKEDALRLETALKEADDLKAQYEKELELLDQEREEIAAEAENNQELDKIPFYLRNLNEDELAEMENLGKIYAAMLPETAADIMPRLYSVRDMASIVFFMKPDSAAALLSAMDASLAADITEELITVE
jgi:flagellar motility protein MotE (MotC chaperone)